MATSNIGDSSKNSLVSADHGQAEAGAKALEKFQQQAVHEGELPPEIKGAAGGHYAEALSAALRDRRNPEDPRTIKDAADQLNGKVSLALKGSDQDLLKSMNTALLSGDTKAFGAAVKALSGDPEKLKAFVADMDKNLQDSRAGVDVSVTKDGNVVVYDKNKSAGVQYDGKTGEASVAPISDQDGNVILDKGEVLNKKPEDVAKSIGATATRGVLGIGCLDIPSLFPHDPDLRDGTAPKHTIPDYPSKSLPNPLAPPEPSPDRPDTMPPIPTKPGPWDTTPHSEPKRDPRDTTPIPMPKLEPWEPKTIPIPMPKSEPWPDTAPRAVPAPPDGPDTSDRTLKDGPPADFPDSSGGFFKDKPTDNK